MKISNSKQELARIISENGGWHQMANLAFYGNFTGECFMLGTDEYPIYDSATKVFYINERDVVRSFKSKQFKNWHQTILSRAEYFHLYPAPDAKPEYCKSVMRSIPEPSDNPTIEQLAADYRNAKDYADRKQAEADAAKADADGKLKALELAGNEIGIIVSPITEVELGDEVECIEVCRDLLKCKGMRGYLSFIDKDCKSTPYLVDIGNSKIWCRMVKLISRK